jgi:SAM-dependent methyltransferase
VEDVDFIWQDQSYEELTGNSNYYDWIIASHVIEHTTDLIEFLNRCDRVLKDDGVLSLVVPDKRYGFDHYRPVSSLSRIIDAHYQPSRFHTPGTAAEFYLNAVARGDRIVWGPKATDSYKLSHSLADARDAMKSAMTAQQYEDYHAWCFVPQAFRLLIQDLYDLELISLRELEYFPTAGFEFFVTLSRKGRGIDVSRLEMLAAIESEISLKPAS